MRMKYWMLALVSTFLLSFQAVAANVAKIGDTPYAALQAALDAAVAGDTITLLADVTCTEKPVFSKGGIVNVDVNGHVFVSTEQARVRNVASADGTVPSNNIKFVSGFGWEVYSPNTTEGVNFRVFPTLDAVMAYEPAKPNPARIYPYEDVKQDKDFVLRKYGHGTSSTICIDPEYDITWDLNGYTVLQESPTGNPLEACIRGKFTLKDSSDGQTGKWIAGACGVTNPANSWYGNGGPALYVLGEGEAVLEGGTISIARNATSDTAGNEVVNSGGLIRVDGGKLNVNGATLQVDDTYGVMAWGGEIEINAGTFDIDPAVSVPVYAIGYYEEVAVEVNSTFAGALCVYGNVAGYKGASATVNVAGVEYATGSGWVVPSVGEGLMTFNGLVLEEGVAVVSNSTSVNTYVTLADAVTAARAGDTITLLADLSSSEIIVLDKAITLDGNGKKLTSTAGRAINVSGADGVTIKNLTINASGERAINIIQNATNVTIDNVTATAANYTVNVASSAPNAIVAIKNSNLTGLNVVNVGAAGANVTIAGGKLTCNDQNSKENYAALALNKDAKNGTITATSVTFDIKDDSKKALNGAEGGTITIDGSTEEVSIVVAYISYGDTYYSFTSLADALAAAQAGQKVTLLAPPTAEANNVVTASTAGATLEAVKAYEVAKLLGGEFKKTTDGKLQYAYEFGVSYITYDPTNTEKPIELVAKLEEGEAAAANRDLTGRFLVVTVTQKSTGDSTKYMAKTDPVLDADGKITVNLPLVDDDSGQGVLFSVSVTDEDPVSATAL